MSSAIMRAALAGAKVWNPFWTAFNPAGTDSYGLQNYTIRHQIDLGGFTGIRNGQGIRLSFLGGVNYTGGIANVFVGNGVRGTPNFVGNQTRVRFNGNNGLAIPLNGRVVTDPINFPFDPSLPLVVAVDCDNTAPGGFAYNQTVQPFVTMWYVGGGPDASNTNMRSANGPYPGWVYGGLSQIEILGQPADTWFAGPLADEPQTFATYTVRMFIPQNVLPQSGGNKMRITMQPYISTANYGATIGSMRVGPAASNWSRTNPAFAGPTAQVTIGGRTSWDLTAMGPPSITSDVIDMAMPTSNGLCVAIYFASTPVPTGYIAGGQFQPVGGGTCYKIGDDTGTIAASGYTASSYNYMSWVISRIEACTSAPSFATSYSNFGGRGDRRGLIIPSTTFTVTNPPVSALVDDLEQTAGPLNNGTDTSGVWQFDFGIGAQEYIDEIAWYAGAQMPPQTYAVEGSNDNSNWDRISTIQTNDGPSPRKIASFVPLTSNRYRYFRLRMIAGVTQASYYQNEVCFKIDPPATFAQSCKLLMHFDGNDGDTAATDSSGFNRPITFVGSQCMLKTANPKFGTASLQCGTGAGQGGHLTIPYSPDFDFGYNGDFTIDAQVRLIQQQTPYGQIVGGNSVGWMVEIQPSPNFISIWSAAIGYYYFGWPSNVDGGAPQLNTWYHIAVSRWGNVLMGFVNGNVCPTRNYTQYPFNLNAGNLLWVGSVDTHNIIGNLDELCIRKGFAYAGPFNPPILPYPG